LSPVAAGARASDGLASSTVRVALVQLTSSDDLEANLEAARRGVSEAAGRGAGFVALPENFAYLRREGMPFPCAQDLDGPIVTWLRELARETGVRLLGGTFPESIHGEARVYNTCVLISPEGELEAVYRKIHLFDVDLGPEARFTESASIAPGGEVVVADTPLGGVGLSVCYDLRFPELYRQLSRRGADWLCVPSAFTPQTGKDHWEVLLRARAIENQAFVLAPAQCGRHSPERSSHGRSLVIDPWGVVLAQAGDRPAVITAECDLAALEEVRARVPALTHRRL
jgi:predicted amidohydrolase